MNLASGHVIPYSTRRDPNAVRSLVTLLCAACLGVLGLAVAPSPARAHPELDRAISHAEDADFDEALAGFDAALATGELTRDELIELISQRALVFQALGRDGALSRDLSLLAMLDPSRELGRAAPPALVSRWNELRSTQAAPVSVRGNCAPSATGSQISAQVEGLRAPDLGQVFIHVRTAGGEWVQKQAAEVDISSGDGHTEYYVEIRGLGGISLAQDGDSGEPLACVDIRDDAGSVAGATTEGDGRHRKKMWWWIGGTVAVVAIATAATVVLLSNQGGSDSDRTTVSKPMVSF